MLLMTWATLSAEANLRWKTFTCCSLMIEVSTAWTMETMRRMLACVSVRMRLLLLSLAVRVAVAVFRSGWRFSARSLAVAKRTGMICVTMRSVSGMRAGSLPVSTGRFCCRAPARGTTRSVLPRTMAV